MTTARRSAVAEEKPVSLTWSAFVTPEQRAHPNFQHLETFRRLQWGKIRHELQNAFGWTVAEGVEPHWTDAGAAVYWQLQKSRKGAKDKGTWTATNPLPANSAAVIAHYLNKGLRLRPPKDGLSSEEWSRVESAALPEAPPDKLPAYWCRRHGQDVFGFHVWKAYMRHCDAFGEEPTEKPPAEVVSLWGSYPFHCKLHDRVFRSEDAALQHIKEEERRLRRVPHVSIEDMRSGHKTLARRVVEGLLDRKKE